MKKIEKILSTLLVIGLASPLLADDARTTTVGMPARIEQLVIEGGELEVKPLEDKRSPIVMRITDVFPHGSAYRYDISFYGLEPGKYDLRDYLRRKDGSSLEDLAPLPVEIKPVLPAGQVEPNELKSHSAPSLGGYQVMMIAGAIVWVAGLLAILFVGRKKTGVGAVADAGPVTLADRLRPMVEEAIAGQLSRTRLAELERILLAYWRRRLNLEQLKPAESIAALRKHEEAGGLLKQLEIWLHRPGPSGEVDVSALLKPYQNLPADAWEPPEEPQPVATGTAR